MSKNHSCFDSTYTLGYFPFLNLLGIMYMEYLMHREQEKFISVI